jgi:hypothetical protein
MLAPLLRIPVGFSSLRIPVGFRSLRRQLSYTAICLRSGQTTTKESTTFDVNYWILGNEPSNEHLPALRIGKNMTINTLKKAIMKKEKHLLPEVPAKNLEIWKVSFAVEGLKAKLANIQLKDSSRDGVEKLGPTRTLGRVFPEPPVNGFLHIVVRLPGMYHSR